MPRRQTQDSSAGFTIIELMIATAVFAVILVVLVVAVLHITNSYYKGVTQSQTQSAARTAMNQIGQSVQFASALGANPTPSLASCAIGSVCGFCEGNQYFQYVLGWEQTTAMPTVFATTGASTCPDTFSTSACTTNPANAACWNGLTSLLNNKMRLSELTVNQVGSSSSYRVSVEVAFGDGDLLCNTNTPANSNSCGAAPLAENARGSGFVNANGEVLCRGRTGDQFCSTATLSTVVSQRLGSN